MNIIMALHGKRSGRATLDLDIAIALSSWKRFEEVRVKLLQHPDIQKDHNQVQRFLYKQILRFDIVPFGKIKQKDDKVYWPPDETVAMSVLGFEETKEDTLVVKIDKEFEIEVVSLRGIFLLKLMAWRDRNQLHNRDADDIAFIIENYLAINQERAAKDHYEEIYLNSDFNFKSAGSRLLGMDVSGLIPQISNVYRKIEELMDIEISSAEESRLINQILETNNSFSYEEALASLKGFRAGLSGARE
ncbi:MAG: nucleotidyl transferase AbiEii/AbiGii toxin family protein [Bacteroidales bacterium]|nr:nucleotidyl transferase AbiEii/AbiGii toxin family protein [Bacteroidales bacterium]